MAKVFGFKHPAAIWQQIKANIISNFILELNKAQFGLYLINKIAALYIVLLLLSKLIGYSLK